LSTSVRVLPLSVVIEMLPCRRDDCHCAEGALPPPDGVKHA
jgi:hypothetical protein